MLSFLAEVFSVPFHRMFLVVGMTIVGVSQMQGVPTAFAETKTPPNIVVILADDLGFGDVKALNPDSKIDTPNLDRLAKDGMTFRDAHSPSAVCTPTRYGLITGRYSWRTSLKRGVLGGYSPPLISPDRVTIATMLKQAGYHTTAIGKWHLGMNFAMQPNKKLNPNRWDGDPGVDFQKPIANGPTTRGFDDYFGVSASLDMPPYVFIENDKFVSQPTIQQERMGFPAFVRSGPRSKDFEFADVLDQLTNRAAESIAEGAKREQPFFLYFAMPAPHKPALPHSRFRETTGLGPYGDFVHQVDWTVGEIFKALDRHNVTDSTIVFFTSDNGSYMYRFDENDVRDHVDDPKIQGYRAKHHRANGPFRGTKADIWEGGHHVPFFVRWPGVVKAGSQSDEPICHVDVFATCAAIAGQEPMPGVAEDSVSLLPMLNGHTDHQRGVPVIHHSVSGMFSIRDGQWKLVLGNGSGGRQNPKGKPFGKPYQLYDLKNDPT
ncbi:MAG: arylsulfatase, partial [Planctomycetaceae bacterium]|nr:arylsulfatase [Planctomycetaceae bacterium]